MTKDQELNILRKAIQDLRIDSYLGKWLNSITDELERDLRSDFIPVLTLAEARDRAESVLAAARNRAEAHHREVAAEADRILIEARAEAAAIRSSARRALESALKLI